MTVTIRDVAERAGVSPMTVSRVTSGKGPVNPTTRERVEEAITALGYVPNRVARNLSRQRTGTLAVLVPDSANPFFTVIVRGAEDVARRAGFRLMLCNTEGDLAREGEYLQDMVAHRVEGLLLAPASDLSRRNVQLLVDRALPFVLIDRTIHGFEGDVVLGDSVAGARDLVTHLVTLGHRQIAIITETDDISTGRDRLQGYRQALLAANITPDPQLIVRERFDIGGGYRGMQRLLALATPPTALFAVNNLVAVGALRAIREAGRDVPHDMALVCFDDVPYAAEICPFLTVMAQPAETFGTIAMQLLLERIGGRASERPRRVVLPAEMIVRTSCAPFAPQLQ
jgi:LacI family transcriptional regulator